MTKVAIIIVTYQGEKWIKRCLQSALDADGDNHIIVVDNASTDATCDLVLNFDSEKIKLLTLKENLGFGKANNKGILLGLELNVDHFFLLNQDAYLFKDTIQKLTKAIGNDYGILSPLHLKSSEDSLDTNFSFYLNPSSCPNLYSDAVLGRELKKVYEVDFVNAAGWLVSTDCIIKVGGFNPVFPHYGEDVNYIHRVKYHQYTVGIVPDSKIIHDRDDRPGKELSIGNPDTYRMKLLVDLSNPNIAIRSLFDVLFELFSKCTRCFTNPFILFSRIRMYYRIRRDTRQGREVSMLPGKTFLQG